MNKFKEFFVPKKTLIKWVGRLFLIPLMMPTLSSYADIESFSKECINTMIERASRNDDYVNARELERYCACNANNYVQNLSTKSCPYYGVIDRRSIDRYFD